MKTVVTRKIVSLLFFIFSQYTYASEDILLIPTNPIPIPFIPFTLNDLIDPKTQKPYKPSDLVQIEIEGEMKAEFTAHEVLNLINEAKKVAAEKGIKLRHCKKITYRFSC